jgi:hypothetical protein
MKTDPRKTGKSDGRREEASFADLMPDKTSSFVNPKL